MKLKIMILGLFCIILSTGLMISATELNFRMNNQSTIVGEVVKIDKKIPEITLKTSKGEEFLVRFSEKTVFKQINPGATSLENAKTIELNAIRIGDRLLAGGEIEAGNKTVLALQVVVVSSQDLANRSEDSNNKWKTDSISGEIASIDTATNIITAKIFENNGIKEISLKLSDSSQIRKFSNNSVDYKETVEIDSSGIKQNDLFRALVDKKDDTNYEINEILIGTFRVLSGTITAIDNSNKNFTIKELVSGQAMTVVFNKSTFSRELSKDLAKEISDSTDNSDSPQLTIGQKVKQMPEIEFSNLKVGDMVLFSSITEQEQTDVYALTMLSGVEPILKPIEKSIKASKNKSNFKLGLPEGLNSLILGF